MANSLATTLARTGNIKDLLSARQVIELARVVFAEVAAHPEQLLGENLDVNKRTALAQIIASVICWKEIRTRMNTANTQAGTHFQ